jgi:raffinose/stachyose/melibiose transport system substrate-binding protein
MEQLERPLSRRQLLKYGAGGLSALGLGPLLAACGGGGGSTTGEAAGGNATLKMWWWGQQEAVGIQKWVQNTIAKFKQETGNTIDPTLMSTSNVIPQFTNAAAAGKPPDIQFLFNGIYHMENVWLGYIEPLGGLVSDDLLKNSGATKLSVFDGKQYRVGFYSIGFGIAYNKDVFDKAGLDGDNPPEDWDAFMDACDKLKSKGVQPIGGGVKDGFFGEWYLVNTLTQNLDAPADALDLFIGELDWRDPKYHEHWVKLEELTKAGYINDDINSLELYQGIALLQNKKAAMALDTTPDIPNNQNQLGEGNVGYMVMPKFGTGKMAGIPVLDTQGFGIPSEGKDHEVAAQFLEYMHSENRVQSMWSISKQIPANTTFEPSVIVDPLIKEVQQKWVGGDHNVYIADLMPTKFWTDAMFVASQKILAGDMTGEQAGDLAHDVTETWRKQNPDMVDNYTKWGNDLSA